MTKSTRRRVMQRPGRRKQKIEGSASLERKPTSSSLVKSEQPLQTVEVLLAQNLTPNLFFTALFSACAACSSGDVAGSSVLAGDASVLDASVADAAPLCALDALPLFVDSTSSVPSRVHVPVTSEGASAVLLMDTGSNVTFLQEPAGTTDPLPDAGAFAIGCRNLSVIGRPGATDSPVKGLPSIGTFGTDMFLAGPTKVDFAASTITSHLPGSPFTEAAAWPNAPFDLGKGLVLAHVSLDGTPVRLLLDTASNHTLWLGQQPQPTDVEVDVTDPQGNTVKLYFGSADLTIGSWHGAVPVLRAPSYPYLEQTAQALGGNVAGLLGLSSLGSQFIVDGDASLVRSNH